MQLPKTHLGSRLAWLVFFSVMSMLSLVHVGDDGTFGRWLTSAGWLAMAVASLLVPMPLGSAKAAVRQSQNEAEREWRPIRNALLWLAGALLISGLVLRALDH